MPMGLHVTHCILSKQKLNTKRSTELELVCASDYVPYNICYGMFIHHQGYLNNPKTFSQDNKDSIRMEVNGRTSITGNSRHIDIRYLFIRDYVDKEEQSIV